MNEQNMNNVDNRAMVPSMPASNNMPSTRYPSKPSGLGKAGAVLNIIIATIPLPIFFILALFALVELLSDSWMYLILILVFGQIIVLEICTIISSARFLEGKNNKKTAGILGILSGNILGGVFIFCSYRI